MIFSVSTVKDTLTNVEKFVRRNLAGGIDHVVVFLDADQPEVTTFLEEHPHATGIRTDRSWWHGPRPSRLNQRQWVNANRAMRHLSPYPWAQWVFHVDGDEVAHLDRDLLAGLPPETRAVRLRPLEAASQRHWDRDPTWFKTLLGTDRLTLLTVLGVIERPRNIDYFRGHVAGKVGVRPAEDLRLVIHRAADADDRHLPMHEDPSLMVLHYEAPDGEEFVRKWRALLASGGGIAQRSGRAATARAIAALLDLGLSDEDAEPYLMRIYERTRLDDLETLLGLGLLEQHDPDTWAHRPEAWPDGAEDTWRRTVEEMREAPRTPAFPVRLDDERDAG